MIFTGTLTPDSAAATSSLPVARLTIDVVEGPFGDESYTFVGDDAFAQADELVRKMLAPFGPLLGYHKADVSVIWANGDAYRFQFGIARTMSADGDPLSRDMASTIRFNAGLYWPRHFETEDSYRGFLAEIVTGEAEAFYARAALTYDLGVAAWPLSREGLRVRLACAEGDHGRAIGCGASFYGFVVPTGFVDCPACGAAFFAGTVGR